MRRGHLYAFQSNRTDPDQYILKELALNSDREENLDIQFPPGTRLAARMRWGLKGLVKSRDHCRLRRQESLLSASFMTAITLHFGTRNLLAGNGEGKRSGTLDAYCKRHLR